MKRIKLLQKSPNPSIINWQSDFPQRKRPMECRDGQVQKKPSTRLGDILRGLAEQITPRGDTFVIRTYGDALDASGNVVARAWCEAVVQRVPEYVDERDEARLKASALQFDANKRFGRSIQLISFRWLNASEV